MNAKRPFAHAFRLVSLVLASTVLPWLIASPAVAQGWNQNYSAPKWLLAVGPGYGGYTSCAEAVQVAVELATASAAANNTTLVITGGGECPGSPPWHYFNFRYANDFPTTPDRQMYIPSYCDAWGAHIHASVHSTNGLFCHPHEEAVTKNIGDCKDCPHGNPIFPGWGNKMQRETDYVGTGPFPLKFIRTYNHARGRAPARSDLGSYWSHSYQYSLGFAWPKPEGYYIVAATRPDGRVHAFNMSGPSSTYAAEADVVERLEKIAGGYRLTTPEDETELYDEQGRLLSITNRAGLTQTMSYFASGPDKGLLQSVSDPFGRVLSFEYDGLRHLSAVVDPSGGRYTYSYHPTRVLLVGVTHPDLSARSYHYDHPTLDWVLTGITDEKGIRYANFNYESASPWRATSTEHAGGAGKVTIAYSTNTASITTHVNGTTSATRTYTYQNVRGVLRNNAISGPACTGCGPAASTYDASGNVSSRTDWNGNRTNYSYDLARHLETSRTEGLTSGGATTPQTRTITTQWHATFRLPTGIAEPLRITTNVYDADGSQCGARGALCSRSVQATTDANGAQGFSATPTGTPRTWTYTYSANGSVLTANGPRSDVSDVTTYTYYANDDADVNKRGQIASVTNAASHRTDITAYNAHGQPLTIVDPNGLTTTLTYDTRRRLKTRSVGLELTSYDYDDAGQLTKVTLPDGSFLSYGYDDAHRLTSITDNQGDHIAYTLDLAGNRTLEEVFDPASQLAQKRSRVYSNLNRLFQELGSLNQTTEYGYDNQGNVTSVKDPLNRITSNQYDPLNRLKQVTDPALGVTQYAYNGLDALTQVTDPRSLVTGYTVDGLGNLTLQASPDTGNTASTYDAAGNLLTQTDGKSQLTTYTYDALNRVSLITFHDGSKQAYAYDLGTNGIGRLSSITETDPSHQQTSLIQYAYSPHGRITSETRTVGGVQYVVGYGYDGSGRLSSITYPSGRAFSYTFDSNGRVSGIGTTFNGQTQPVVSAVAYHPFGGVKSYTLGNGHAYTRAYDQDGRINSYTLGAKTFSIGYDAASRIEFINEFGNPANSNTYGYDSLDRLTSSVIPGTAYGYTYDAVGNRLTKTAGAATDALTYSTTSNRVATLTPASGPPRSFVFDPNGATTNDGLNTYAYDVRGRMVQATSSIGTTSYQVNALGQRVRKTNSQGDTVFHYDTAGRLIAETTPAGAFKRELIYLGDIPVGVVR